MLTAVLMLWSWGFWTILLVALIEIVAFRPPAKIRFLLNRTVAAVIWPAAILSTEGRKFLFLSIARNN